MLPVVFWIVGGSCPSLVHPCLTISSVSVGGIRQLIVQISIIDTTLMKYWITGQVRTMMRSVMCKSKFSMGEKIISNEVR